MRLNKWTKSDSGFQILPNFNRQMTICEEGWTSEWTSDLSIFLQAAEGAEKSLSYLSSHDMEAARKRLGSYYTPTDVALYFWSEFFSLNKIKNSAQIIEYWEQHHFVEPAAGAGALIFALLKKAGEIGLPRDQIAMTRLTIVDINQAALDFVSNQMDQLSNRWGMSFRNVDYFCGDFRDYSLPNHSRKPLFFGNPPFVTNPRGSKWKNLFADFLEHSLQQSAQGGQCHFILPISLAFSRDYSQLRDKILAMGNCVALSSFDNIPNSLFSSGKPKNTNTNKANSQRCSILTIFPSGKTCVMSTKLHRWRKNERARLLTSRPEYHDITNYSFDSQFPRPENAAILRYLNQTVGDPRLHTLLSETGSFSLYVASVARNFIGIREESAPGVHHLRFNTKKKLYTALLILSSDVFLDYWRTVGDGFHITRTNLLEFPLHRNLMKTVSGRISKGRYLWENRLKYVKFKRHPNGVTVAYDFSASALRLKNNF